MRYCKSESQQGEWWWWGVCVCVCVGGGGGGHKDRLCTHSGKLALLCRLISCFKAQCHLQWEGSMDTECAGGG